MNCPEIIEDEFFKSMSVNIRGFAGLQIRHGPYGAISDVGTSDGLTNFSCGLEVSTKLFLDVAGWVESNAQVLLNQSLEAFFPEYLEIREVVAESMIDENSENVVPDISNSRDLINLCGIAAVHVKGDGDKGAPHFGIEFGCNWDESHGVGARFIGLNLVKSGYGACAFDF